MNAITVQNGTIVALRDEMNLLWCVYEIYATDRDTGTDSLIYLGCCELIDLTSMPDAKRNSIWHTVTTPRTIITQRVIATGEQGACFAHRSRLVMDQRPICNVQGHDTLYRVGRIRCDQTGQIFATQTEAAKALRISQPQLSQHLRGNAGYRTCKGYTFSRVGDDET